MKKALLVFLISQAILFTAVLLSPRLTNISVEMTLAIVALVLAIESRVDVARLHRLHLRSLKPIAEFIAILHEQQLEEEDED